jgi:hypothetical protein
MQVSLHPRAFGTFFLLSRLVSPFPIAFGISPKSDKRGQNCAGGSVALKQEWYEKAKARILQAALSGKSE